MKQRLLDFEERLCELVTHDFQFHACTFEFIPVGDSAFSYIVEDRNANRRYLKVIDPNTRKGKLGINRLDGYLPLMLRLHEDGLFTNLPKPIATADGKIWCRWGQYMGVLFEFIEGSTLEYPFDREIQTKIASQVAKLHTLPLANLPAEVPQESYSLDFGRDLIANVESAESYSGTDAVLQQLKLKITLNGELIRRFWTRLCELQVQAKNSHSSFVLCHGDLWGGNIIQQANGSLAFVDWEACMMAPRERDLFSYVSPDYIAFQQAYAAVSQVDPASLNPVLIAFYTYRQQLSNLSQWLHNLLNESFDDEQRQNDLEMIGFHCLDRWESIERHIDDILHG